MGEMGMGNKYKEGKGNKTDQKAKLFAQYILGASEITANLYCNGVHLNWEGCAV